MPFSLPHPHPRFQAFASSLTSLINRKPDEATILQEGRALGGLNLGLAELVGAFQHVGFTKCNQRIIRTA